ncbi:MAG: hypothetical protein IPO66_22395 [Rhodanobacteraceae bacterium]|nr:hypothetical protein [Rhodanobacteraceae bacterium]
MEPRGNTHGMHFLRKGDEELVTRRSVRTKRYSEAHSNRRRKGAMRQQAQVAPPCDAD